MKCKTISFVMLMALLVLAGCSSSKKVAYFQNIQSVDFDKSKGLYDAKILPKDMLTITVNTQTPEAALPFNLAVSNVINPTGQLSSGAGSLQGYLVDNDGNINFPIVKKISPYLSKTETPVVTVRMSSYHVTVLGEVNKPGVVAVTTEKMSIMEALAESGDLTIYGKRDNVILIRESETGQKEYHIINLNDANVFNSPYYYLQQNDIVYVEPNKAKAGHYGSRLLVSLPRWHR